MKSLATVGDFGTGPRFVFILLSLTERETVGMVFCLSEYGRSPFIADTFMTRSDVRHRARESKMCGNGLSSMKKGCQNPTVIAKFPQGYCWRVKQYQNKLYIT